MSGYDYKTYESCRLYQKSYKNGLVNLGNTCYLNASVMALSNCLGFTHYFVSNSFAKVADRKKPEYNILAVYLKTLGALLGEKVISVKPVSFHTALLKYTGNFEKNKQHDAYECMLSILDIIHKSLSFTPEVGPDDKTVHRHVYESQKEFNTHFKNDWSVITELFFGQTIQKIKCTDCRKVSRSYHPFLGMNLPVLSKKGMITSIYDLLNFYYSKQQIEKECEECKKNTKHTMKSKIIKLPKYLIVHFNRFNNDLSKKNDLIAFASDLEVSDYTVPIKDSTSYELISVINHYNMSLDTGHYTCINRTFDGQWVFIDDTNVINIEPTDVCTKEAYILIYELNEF